MGSFVQARLEELPPWIGGAVSGDGAVDTGVEMARVAGEAQDAELATLKAGVAARFLDSCPDDGLDEWGRGVSIERMVGESHAAYRARLEEAWPTWELAGTAAGIEAALRAYGITDVEVVEDWQGHRGESACKSHVWVLLGPRMPWEPRRLPLTLGSNTRLGSTATAAQVRQVKALILKWKSPHAYPMGARLLFDDSVRLGPRRRLPLVMKPGSALVEWPIGKALPQQMPFLMGGYDKE